MRNQNKPGWYRKVTCKLCGGTILPGREKKYGGWCIRCWVRWQLPRR